MDTITHSDHDLLIRLETKLDQALVDVKELRDGTSVRLIDMERRVESLEILNTEINPRKMKENLTNVLTWQRDQQITAKVFLAISAGIGAIVGFILSSLNDIFNLINRTH